MIEVRQELTQQEYSHVVPLVQGVAHELFDAGRIRQNFDDVRVDSLVNVEPGANRMEELNFDGTYVVIASGYPEVQEFMRLVHSAGERYSRSFDGSNWRDINDEAARGEAEEATKKYLRKQLDPTLK